VQVALYVERLPGRARDGPFDLTAKAVRVDEYRHRQDSQQHEQDQPAHHRRHPSRYSHRSIRLTDFASFTPAPCRAAGF
jgi:hypothetical protein